MSAHTKAEMVLILDGIQRRSGQSVILRLSGGSLMEEFGRETGEHIANHPAAKEILAELEMEFSRRFLAALREDIARYREGAIAELATKIGQVQSAGMTSPEAQQ